MILVVDDEETVRSVTKDILENYGYRVWLAENGLQAIEAYSMLSDEIDLVILDMIMPKMGGSETFSKLKDLNPEANAILSSGYSQSGRAQEILDSGVTGFVQKPFEINELLSEIRSVLDLTEKG